jgi:hydrogenase maturation factor
MFEIMVSEMCQATMGKVVRVNKGSITVEHKGKILELDSKLVTVKKGDYVLFSADIAIEKVNREEAEAAMGGSACR